MCKTTLNISDSVKEICLKTEWRRASLGHFVVKRETGENERVCALIKPRVPLQTESIYLIM